MKSDGIEDGFLPLNNCYLVHFPLWMCAIQGRKSSWTELNWTERTERWHLVPVPWTELAADPIRQANWTEWTLLKRFWTEITSLRQHTTPRQASKHSQQSARSLHSGDKPRGRWAGIFAETAPLLLPNNWRLDWLYRAWAGNSHPGRSVSGPEEFVKRNNERRRQK